MKRICWIFATSFLFCVLIFHHALLTLLATWSLQAYSISKLGKSLHYDDISLAGSQLIITRPRFDDDSLFTAERMAIIFDFNFWKRQLHVDIEIIQPHWHFQNSAMLQWETWAKLLSQEEKWITIHPQFHLKQGLLTWIFDDPSHHHQLKFDLEINKKAGGYIKLCFDSPESMNNSLVLHTKKEADGVELKCTCENVQCPSLATLAQFLGVKLAPWLISSGSLQGQLTAIFPKMQRPYFEGELMVENLVFHHLEQELTGEIGQARLQLQKNQITYAFNDQAPTIMGELEILKSASLTSHSPLQEWSIQHIQGNIQLNSMETVWLNLHAQAGNFHHPSEWDLQGRVNLNAQRALNLELRLACTSPWGQPDGKLHLALNQQKELKHAEIQLEKLSYVECGFLQTLLASYWPIFDEILFEDGEVSALVEADLNQEGIGELHVKQLEAWHVRSKVKPWNMTFGFRKVKGHGQISLGKKDFWQSFQTELHLEDGEMQFEDLSPPLPMKDIQAHLLVHQGYVEHSLVTLQVAGLKGKMDIEWGEHKQLLTFKLDGIVQDLADLFPNILQEGLRKHFYQNRLMILANLKSHHKLLELDGTIHIQRANTNQMDLVHFGCELKKINFGSGFKSIPVGWFHAKKLPLEKFLSPFIFTNGILSMSGEAEFKGSFDDQTLLIKYDADHLKIENEDLLIEIPHLHSTVPGQLVGSHQVNLQTYAYQGTLPIQSASYYEKNSGLVFQDIQGSITFKNDWIHILPIEAYCEGIYFNGELELDYHDPAPSVFDLSIQCPTLSGKVSQIQHLLAHLNQPSLLHHIPLEGEVTGKGKGLSLKFNFVPQDYHLQANAQGAITEGVLSLEEADLALKGIDMDLEYNHERQLLELSDIQGTLLVGKPRRAEEYLFTGHHIHFYRIAQPDIDLDIAIKDRENELLRIVGFTQEKPGEIKSFDLNQKLSHFGCIYPDLWQCQFKEGFDLEKFEFRSQFDLGRFLQELQRFRQTGLLFLSHTLIDKLSQFSPIKGQGLLDLRYQSNQTYHFLLEGSHIKSGNSSEHLGLLKGSKQDKKWIIDQFQWDDWNIYAELHQSSEKWRIPFLGLKVGQTLLLGLEGDWRQEEALLQGKLKFCEIDLAQLDRFEGMKSFVTKWWPKGVLNATGEIEWNLLASNPWEGCKASLSAEVHNLTLRDYPLHIRHAFQITLHPPRHFSLENIQMDFIPQGEAFIDLKRFNYQLTKDAIHSMEALFQIPHHQLTSIGEKLHYYFPDLLDASVKEILVAAKQQGQLKGVLSIDNRQPNSNVLQLELEDGLYTFKKREYDLKQFKLQIAGEEMQFSAFSQQERYPFQIVGQTQWPSCQEGQCKLLSPNVAQPLMIQWENQPQQGWIIRSMQGEFGGCSLSLKEDKESSQGDGWIALQGQVSIDFNRLAPAMTLDVADSIQKLKIGSLYHLAGRFWMNPDAGKDLWETFSFKGNLISDETILKGYQMQSLRANVQYVPGRLDMQNVLIQDPAGTIKAANCTVLLNDNKDKWNFFVPRLTGKNLQFSLLRDMDTSGQMNEKFRSLILKRVEFQDLKGELNNVPSWQGEGNLQFLNASRKNSMHPILAIPAEIILRLGLDPQVLNPVTGTIYFKLQGNRFYLNRFKDVYSEGRGSKFNLADDAGPSWMDYDGNLSIHVRMKQYNLLFKLAELFTVSIQGNIKEPTYALQKQSKTSRKERILPILND